MFLIYRDNQGISLNNSVNSKQGNSSSTTTNTAPVSILKRDKPSNGSECPKTVAVSNFSPSSSNFTTNFFGNVAAGYTILLKTFRYLKVKVCNSKFLFRFIYSVFFCNSLGTFTCWICL